MKTIVYMGTFLFLLLSLSACRKDHELEKLEADYQVVTNYDPEADFGSFETYYLPDSVLYIGSDDRAVYLDSVQAAPILDAFRRNMERCGYVPASDKATADLGLQVTYMADTYRFVTFIDLPYWWGGFTGYWSPFYWGSWGYWYYPYPVSYTVSTGALLADLINLQAKQGEHRPLPVVWQTFLTGLRYNRSDINLMLAARGIDQSFAQSTYLSTHQ